MNPYVSIITACYNAENSINHAIISVIKQNFIDWEMIIVDDSSIDNSIEIIDQYRQNDRRIKVLKKTKNEGAGTARNNGIKMAKGRFIAFLDSDDLWLPNKLELQVNFMIENNYAFTFTDYIISNELKGKQYYFNSPTKKVNYTKEIFYNRIACSTVMIDLEHYGKVYMPELRSRQDWGLWLKLLKKKNEAHLLQKHLSIYSTGKDSISSNKKKQFKYHWTIYRNVLNFNVFMAAALFTINIAIHILAHCMKKIFLKEKID